MMSYNNSISSIRVSRENIFEIGFRLFDSSIDMVLNFEYGHDIIVLKLATFDKGDYIEIKPALCYGNNVLLIYEQLSQHF